MITPQTKPQIVVPRKLIWVSEHDAQDRSGRSAHTPGGKRTYEESNPPFGEYLCCSQDTTIDQTFYRVHHSRKLLIWYRKPDGSIACCDRYDHSPEAEYFKQFRGGFVGKPRFLVKAADEILGMSTRRMPTYYFKNCTVLMQIPEYKIAKYIKAAKGSIDMEKFSEVVGCAYAARPKSNHEALKKLAAIESELALHNEILSAQSPLHLVAGKFVPPSWQ
jgi:hypothetical protein